jgi:N-glycosylase/DNA lyase
MNSETDNVIKLYKENKGRIKNFIENCSIDEDECLFGELCFCILTPQSRAKICREAINRLKKDKKMFTANLEELRSYLKGVRFSDRKALFITEAREKFPELKAMIKSGNTPEVRSWLVENVKGLGMKESAHFMRNVGFKGLAIIDVHVQNFLRKIGRYDKEAGSLTKKQYVALEREFLELAKELRMPPEELDIAIWMYQSGEKEFYG